MLDLLLLRAQQAASKLYSRAIVMPSPYDLWRLKRGAQFCDMMLEAIVYIAHEDGKSTLTERKSDVVMFGDLLAFTLWQLKQRQLSNEEYIRLLADNAYEN